MPPAHRVEGFNPLCGDEVVLYLDVDDGVITDVKIAGQGCSISQASTSMMSAAVKGKSVADARTLTRAFKALMSIHESKIGGETDDVDAAADELAGRAPRRPRGAPGRGEVPRAHQVRHPRLEHAHPGPRRDRRLTVHTLEIRVPRRPVAPGSGRSPNEPSATECGGDRRT